MKTNIRKMKELISKIGTYIIPSLIVFFAPVLGLAIAISVLVLLDTVLGIGSAYKQKQKITSRKLSQLISKMFLYLGVLYLIFPVDYYLLNEIFKMLIPSVTYFATKLVALSLATIEIKSCAENLKSGWKIDIFQTIKGLVDRAKEVKNDVDEITK